MATYYIRPQFGAHDTLTETDKRRAVKLAREWVGQLEVGNRVTVGEPMRLPFACYARTPEGVKKLVT